MSGKKIPESMVPNLNLVNNRLKETQKLIGKKYGPLLRMLKSMKYQQEFEYVIIGPSKQSLQDILSRLLWNGQSTITIPKFRAGIFRVSVQTGFSPSIATFSGTGGTPVNVLNAKEIYVTSNLPQVNGIQI
jgi:hypothetical protein